MTGVEQELSEDLLTVVSVDGVNAISGETANASQSGYVLAPGQTTEIAGWRKNMDEVAAFYFTRIGDSYAARTEPTALFAESATVSLGGRVPLGQLGLLLPALARQHDLRDAVLLAELDLDELLARRNTARTLKPLPQFPSVRRDIAMLVPESVSHEAVLAAVRQAKAANLETVDLFDVFRGKGIPAGQKSVAYAFTYRHAERTLTDAEVNAAHDKLVAHLTKALGATVRA